MNKIEEKKFIKLFGISYDEIGEFLVISPFFNPKLFASFLKNSQYFRGMLFHGLTGVFKDQKVTFIYTGMGQSLVADCILAQDQKRVKAIIFLGAIGAVRDLKIADNVIIEKAFFDTTYYNKLGIAFGEGLKKEFFPAKKLVDSSLMLAKEKNIFLKKASTLSIHTFIDQGAEVADELYRAGVQSVDLECALFYAAANLKKINAIALCFVSDNLLTRPFWGEFSLSEKLKIKNQMAELVKFSLELCPKLSFK
ncbi:MAG: hypothetical protein KJ915_05015 [Candidatus Omnitrophica bacterium]|nr:hypothetical protein [Candidatus Omnitrophota bacterium]